MQNASQTLSSTGNVTATPAASQPAPLRTPAVKDSVSRTDNDKHDTANEFKKSALRHVLLSNKVTMRWETAADCLFWSSPRGVCPNTNSKPSTISSIVSLTADQMYMNVLRVLKNTLECMCEAVSVTDALVKSAFFSFSHPSAVALRSLTDLQLAGHRYSAENDADPGLIPHDLQLILNGITQMEEMLCSLASPCFVMWVSKGGQYKMRGNVITFSQDVSSLCTILPRIPEELDVLIIRKADSQTALSYKDFRVRKHKVLTLLRFLQEHNPCYKDITIRSPTDTNLPDDDSVFHRLPHSPIDHCPDNSLSTDKTTVSNVGSSDELDFDCDQLAQENNSFVPSLSPLPTEAHAIANMMQISGLTVSNDNRLPWPPTGPALSEYSTRNLFTMAFPTLFPLSFADPSIDRPHKLELHEWVKHLLRYRDSRFATHPRFRFFVLNLIFRHRAMQHGKFLFSCNISHHRMTIAQLKNSLSQHDSPQLAADIMHCFKLKTVKATRPYWNMEGGKLRDMIAQIGTPTFFYTLSMADMSWPDLHKLMPEDLSAPSLTASQASQVRFRNLTGNPHIVASYLMCKHHFLMDTVLQHLDLSDDAYVSDYWFRVEWQACGSGSSLSCFSLPPMLTYERSGHIHSFLWLENTVPVDTIDWNDPSDRLRLISYFSHFMTAFNPDPTCARRTTNCLLADLLDPTTCTAWDWNSDHCDLCNRCQEHGCVIRGQRQCCPSQCFKHNLCRFHFPFPPTSTPAAVIERSVGIDCKRFAPVQNNPWLNQHSKPLLLAWHANMDLQPVLDQNVAIKYVSKYASKPKVASDSYHHALSTFCHHLPQNLPAERTVQSLFAKMVSDRDISAQEAIHLLLYEKLVGCSWSFVNLNADVNARNILKDMADLDDDDVAFKDNFFRRYKTCLAEFPHLNAVEYCSLFDVHKCSPLHPHSPHSLNMHLRSCPSHKVPATLQTSCCSRLATVVVRTGSQCGCI